MLKINHKVMVGGLEPLTLIDYPGKIASVLFLQGCNLRCRFCYNRSLLDFSNESSRMGWESVINFLKDRQGFIEGVVFSGGEPCLQNSLPESIQEVKELGFSIALHTNGFYPEMVKCLIEDQLIDFVAIDYKANPKRFEEVAGINAEWEKFLETAKLVIESGIDYEFRTTVHPDLLSDSDISEIADSLHSLNAKRFVLQKYKHGNAFDETLRDFTGPWIKDSTLLRLREKFEEFSVRGDQSKEKSYGEKVKTA